MHSKPLIVYLHRYSPEYEAMAVPSMRPLFDRLLQKNDILYVSMKGIRPPDPEVRRGLRIIELPLRINPYSGVSKLVKTALFYLYLPLTYWKIKKAQPDVIISQEPLPFVPILMAHIGVPTIIGGFGDFWWRVFLGGSRRGISVANFMERMELRQWQQWKIAIFTSTRTEADMLIQRGMDPNYVHIVPTQNLPGLFFPCPAGAVREKMGFTPGQWVVAIHGTIRPGKGYSQLLEWWQALIRQHSNWRLLIIGGAGGEGWCRKQIQRLKLEHAVAMTGWLATHGDVNRHLNAADCLLVIRRNSDDNQGIVPCALPHSLATGKPTIATGLAGMAEIVRHGVDGFLFEPDNFDSFRTVLEYVAAHPAEAAKVGQAGIAREKECCDPNVTAAKSAAFIERIIARCGKI